LWTLIDVVAWRRFHGSYEAVYGGWAGNAFTALTGGISEKMRTYCSSNSTSDGDDGPPSRPAGRNDEQSMVSAGQLYCRLSNALASGAFVTATALPPPQQQQQQQQQPVYAVR